RRAEPGQRARPRQRTTAPDDSRATLTRELLFDLLLPALEVEVPDRAVQVDRGLLDALEQIVVQRAVVDRVADLHGQAGRDERDEVADRIDGQVDTHADAVTHRGRREHRQHEVRPGSGAPRAEGLAEVLVARSNAPVILGGIEETAHARRAVDEEPRGLA